VTQWGVCSSVRRERSRGWQQWNVEEILDEARQGAYDQQVIGAHTTTGLMGMLLDDVAHQIISHADRPILVARPRREG
jgi:nucleotide-binding universal stress UspA family protein